MKVTRMCPRETNKRRRPHGRGCKRNSHVNAKNSYEIAFLMCISNLLWGWLRFPPWGDIYSSAWWHVCIFVFLISLWGVFILKQHACGCVSICGQGKRINVDRRTGWDVKRIHMYGSRFLLVFRCDRFCTCSALSTVAVIVFFTKIVVSCRGPPPYSGWEKVTPATVIFWNTAPKLCLFFTN